MFKSKKPRCNKPKKESFKLKKKLKTKNKKLFKYSKCGGFYSSRCTTCGRNSTQVCKESFYICTKKEILIYYNWDMWVR